MKSLGGRPAPKKLSRVSQPGTLARFARHEFRLAGRELAVDCDGGWSGARCDCGVADVGGGSGIGIGAGIERRVGVVGCAGEGLWGAARDFV